MPTTSQSRSIIWKPTFCYWQLSQTAAWGLGNEKKVSLFFPTTLACFAETNLQVTAKAYASVHSYHISCNDPENSFTADKNYKFWRSARWEHLEVQSLQHQFVQNQLTPLKWSHIFSKDQTRFGSVTIRKEWAKRKRWISVLWFSKALTEGNSIRQKFSQQSFFFLVALWQNKKKN